MGMEGRKMEGPKLVGRKLAKDNSGSVFEGTEGLKNKSSSLVLLEW